MGQSQEFIFTLQSIGNHQKRFDETRQSCNVKMNVLALEQIKKASLEIGKLVKS